MYWSVVTFFKACGPVIALAFAVLSAACNCAGTPPPPGDEVMGDYNFHAEPVLEGPGCGLTNAPTTGFDFVVKLTRFSTNGDTYATIGGISHNAVFDGQKVHAEYAAIRNFDDCTSCDTTLTETLDMTLLSKSQSDVIGGDCNQPVPPIDPDAGITGPGTTPSGFDSVRACGTLGEKVTAVPRTDNGGDAGICLPACNTCVLSYTISGDRR